jgi:V8-like Glu-specific endopeptidase
MAKPSEQIEREWTAATVRSWFEQQGSARSLPPKPMTLFHLPAALLSAFDPKKLRMPEASEYPDEATLVELLRDCDVVVHPSDNSRVLWRMNDAARRSTLAALDDVNEFRKVLELNDRLDEPVQRAVDQYVFGTPPVIDQDSEEHLMTLLEVVGWLEAAGCATALNLPDLSWLRSRLDLVRVLTPLRKMLGPHFQGRESEIARIRRFVQTAAQDRSAPKPLVVFGHGGAGKTTLVARFLVEFSEKMFGRPAPFVFLDFDLPSIDADQTATLLIEAIRQLSAQDHSFRHSAGAIQQGLQELLKRSDHRSGSMSVIDSPADVLMRNPEECRVRLEQFAELLDQPTWQNLPLLFVIDTFEEVQYYSSKVADRIVQFVGMLREYVPSIRVVIVGRAPLQSAGRSTAFSDIIQVDELDVDSAVACLIAEGIRSDFAAAVYRSVGGSPLALRLAAVAVRQESQGDFQDFLAENLSERIDSDLIQGVLLRRVLGHIQSPEIRKLVHPGFAVRRISPEIIREVLAEPCGLDVSRKGREIELWNELARETALVLQDSPGTLMQRPELRRQMIQMLRRSKPDLVKKIHETAIRYYERFDDDESRAEELYHRLCLEQPREVIDDRWRDHLAPYLAPSREELPESALIYLASRSTPEVALEAIDVDEGMWNQQELVTWERKTAQWAEELMRQDRLEDVDRALRVRADRSDNSPLYLIHARVLERLNRNEEAIRLLRRAIHNWPYDSSRVAQIDLVVFLVRVLADEGRVRDAQEVLSEFAALFVAHAHKGQRLYVAALRARLAPPDDQASARHELAMLVESWSATDLRQSPFESQSAAADLLDPICAAAFTLVMSAVGIGPMPAWRVEQFTRRLVQALPPRNGSPASLNLLALQLLPYSDLSTESGIEYVRAWVQQSSPESLGRAVSTLLQADLVSPQFKELIAQILRREDDVVSRREAEARESQRRAHADRGNQELHRRVMQLFSTYSQLHHFALEHFDVRLENVVSAGQPFEAVVYGLISWLQSSGRLLDFTAALANLSGTPSRSSQNESLERNTMTIQVQGKQFQQLVEALNDAFPTNSDLARMLEFRLSKKLPELAALPNEIAQVAFEVIKKSNAQGWTGELIAAARETEPRNPKLFKIGEDFGLSAATAELERIVRDDLSFLDIGQWRERLGEAEGQVCRVETPGGMGTGFLVGVDLVLTCRHVVAEIIDRPDLIKQTVLRFDYKRLSTGDTVYKGTEYRLRATNAVLDHLPHSPVDLMADPGDQTPDPDQLDFALLRVEGEPGSDPIATERASPQDKKRGWMTRINAAHAFPTDSPIFIVQHPKSQPLKLALDTKAVITVNNNGTRVRYKTNTEPGSSGSPVFNEQFELVALHQSGDRSIVPTYNQGIPIGKILQRLANQGIVLPAASA